MSLAVTEGLVLFLAVCGTIYAWGHPLLADWVDVATLLWQAGAVALCCIVAFYYNDLYDLRVNLELIAIRRICEADPFPDFSEQRDFWLVPEDRRKLDGEAVARADEALHTALVANAGNAEMARVHRDITERIRIIRRLDFIEPARIATAFDEHAKLLRALFARKQERAEMLLKAHIDASRAEIRHLTLHRLAEAARQRTQPEIRQEGTS